MESSHVIAVVALAGWAAIKFWPQIKEGVAKVTPSKSQDEAVTALEAAQTLHKFLAQRPGCRKSLDALGTLTLGNFLPASPAAAPAAPPESGERKVSMEVRHYNLNVPIDKTPLDAAVAAAPVVASVNVPQAPAAAQ